MHRRVCRLGGAAFIAAVLALPATAAATTTTVYAGPPPGTKQLVAKLGATSLGKYQPDINAFFNRRATIHVGDAVSFQLRGFHTVDLPAAGGSDVPFIIPSGGVVTGVNDAAGNPFWFNGRLPNLAFNPLLFKASGGKVYTGKSRIDTGAPLGPHAGKPFVVRFTKAGTYKYFCDIHPGMIGYITVKAKAAPVPSTKANAAARLAQLTSNIKGAVKAAKGKLPANTVDLGLAAPGGVELFSMFPASLTVSRGTVVTFRMSAYSFDTHTATFGSTPELASLVKNFGPTVGGQAAFPSDPTQPIMQSATSHGDGFANTGVLDRDPTTKTIPSSGKIQFNSPGTYQYICLIHPFMRGTIVVQ